MFRTRRLVVFLVFLAGLAGCRARLPYEGKSIAQLERMLQAADPRVQAQGAYGLSLHGPEARAAVPPLIEALKKDARVRQYAALALGQIGPEAREAVPALAETLRDPEWTVRRQAALALGKIGPEAREAVPALRKLKQDRDHLVRKAAQEALTSIQPGRGGNADVSRPPPPRPQGSLQTSSRRAKICSAAPARLAGSAYRAASTWG